MENVKEDAPFWKLATAMVVAEAKQAVAGAILVGTENHATYDAQAFHWMCP